MSKNEIVLQDPSGKSVRQLCYEAALGALNDAINVCTNPSSMEGIQEMINKLKADHPEFNKQKLSLKNAEVIELTEVFDGGFNRSIEDISLTPISTLEEAIQLLQDKKINGFYIGGEIYGVWSSVGVIRKWGDAPGFVQVKQIDAVGREGSGLYDNINSTLTKKTLAHLLELATIDPDGPVAKRIEKIDGKKLSEEYLRPQFKAI